MKTFSLFVLISGYFIGTQTADPCITYFEMTDMTRSVSHHLDLNTEEKCDRLLVPGWYRIKINKTDGNMPTACPSVFQCGSTKPIWLNGTIPKTENEQLTYHGCYVGYTGCCEKTINITVKNCGTFNVYNLPAPDACMGRYCVVERKRCASGFSSESGYEPCKAIHISFNEIPSVQFVEPDHNTDAKREKRMLRFKCKVTILPINTRDVFDIMWTVNGKTILPVGKNMKVEELDTKGLLTTTDLIHNEIKTAGFWAKCSIRAREHPNSVPTHYKESQDFYAGITVQTDSITVNAGESAVVKIRSTIPIRCDIYKKNVIPCKYRFEMLDFQAEMTASTAFCTNNKKTKASKLCGVDFDAWDWRTYQILKIPTKPNQQIKNHFPAIVRLKTNNKVGGDELWNDYQLPDVKINIRGVNFQPASCTSVTDPHITTFDRRYFTTFESGEYVLYKHKNRPIAVHVIHRRLGSTPTWNCAIAVRAGSDTFIVYGCSGAWKSRRAFCDRTHGSYLDVYKRNQGKEYEVHLPTGARVKITLFSRMYMNVHIYASTLDEGQTSGLCGTFNRKSGDDFTEPNGAITNKNSFVKSWHVKPDDSLFIAKARGRVINKQQYFCSCVNKSTETETKFSDEANCDWQDAMPVCAAPRFEEEMCKFRAKRDGYDDKDIDIPVDIVKYKPAPPNIGQWINGWNESAAVEKCRNVLHASKFYRQCKDLVPFNETESMRSCVEDIKFLGHSNLSSQVDKPLRESCLNMIRINTTLWTSTNAVSNSGTSILVSIIDNDCPSDCSVEEEKRGSCNNGTCKCFPNFTGDDCSVDTRKPPEINIDEQESRCDATSRGCTYVSMFGSNFFNTGNGSKCRLEEQHVNNDTNTNQNNVHLTDAELVSFSEVKCPIPNGKNRKRRDLSSLQPAGFLVSITNNGNAFSNKIPIVVYDSSCTNCFLVNGVFICNQKDNICVVNGKCFSLSSSACTSNRVKEDNKSNNLWIIGAVLGAIAVCAVVCFLVTKKVKKPRTRTGSSYPSMSDDAYFTNSKAAYSKT